MNYKVAAKIVKAYIKAVSADATNKEATTYLEAQVRSMGFDPAKGNPSVELISHTKGQDVPARRRVHALRWIIGHEWGPWCRRDKLGAAHKRDNICQVCAIE